MEAYLDNSATTRVDAQVQELMKVIDKYVKQNPAEKENKTLERFFDLLDVMDMEW